MRAWPDAGAVRDFLARARRRRALVAGLQGAAAGALAAALVMLVARDGVIAAAVGAVVVVAGAAVRARQVSRSRPGVAYAVERAAPECRNIVITAAELIDRPERVRPEIGGRVCRDAARAAARLDLRRLFPAGRAASMFLAAVAMWAAAGWLATARPASPALLPATGDGGGPAGPSVVALTADIIPPDYAGRAAETLENPAELRALLGSRIRLRVSADAASISIARIEGTATVSRDETGTFSTEFEADRSGYVTVEPRAPDGTAGSPRLLTLVVEPDLAPRVRLTEPGQDLFLPDASSRLPVTVEAEDDLGLATLAVTYTKVTGSGENFDFVSGEVPLERSRPSTRAWTASGALDLGALDLEPGDMVVYRGVAADRRPGAPPVESDAFIVEILAPGEAAAAGFAIDDQRDRYALSQRMVLIKTERLAAERPAMSQAELLESAQVIAAEQRQVRAEFVFMMGGELTDFAEDADPFILHEEDEAHGEADIAAGRLVNQGRAELTRAVRAMSVAAAALVDGSLDDALDAERVALEALQNAFSSSRYILRTLSERESIDLDRRLSGALGDVAGGSLPAPARSADAGGDALRGVLADLLALTAQPPEDRPASRAVGLAQRVLAIDPARDDLRAVASALTDAARAIDVSNLEAAAGHLDRAATGLTTAARAAATAAPDASPDPRTTQLLGARADALRRGGGRQ